MHTYISWESGSDSSKFDLNDSSEIDEEVSAARKENIIISRIQKVLQHHVFHGLYGPNKTHHHNKSI